MDIHRRIIGILYFVFGAFIAFTLIGTVLQNLDAVSVGNLMLILGQVLIGLFFFLSSFGGFFLLKKRDWAYRVCFLTSFVWLLFIPIGTVIGLYYFWFHHKHKRVIG